MTEVRTRETRQENDRVSQKVYIKGAAPSKDTTLPPVQVLGEGRIELTPAMKADYSNPQSRRLSWMMISLTALRTNRICCVSVAHVKWT